MKCGFGKDLFNGSFITKNFRLKESRFIRLPAMHYNIVVIQDVMNYNPNGLVRRAPVFTFIIKIGNIYKCTSIGVHLFLKFGASFLHECSPGG